MSANFLNTNRNSSRYFFATSEDGEQTLGLQYGTTGGGAPISTMAVTISGTGGNGVVVTQAPAYLATEFCLGENALMGGTNSTYQTLSTINTNLTGFNISSDRAGGSGIATIESYSGNAALTGFEFVTRGVNSALLSTNNVGINGYLSSIGAVGATARLGGNGTMITADFTGSFHTSLDVATGAGGRTCFGIQDLSGAVPYARWAIGTSTAPTGGNAGSDFTIYSYQDNSAFLNSPLIIRREDSGLFVRNISSLQVFNATQGVNVFPATKNNTEFGQAVGVPIAGACNQATAYVPLFSTPVSGLSPFTQTLLNVNFINSLSSGSNLVNYKVGFSTATAYTNILQSSYVPGIGGTWTPSDVPGANTPIGATNICAMLDSDGLNPDGTGFLYVLGQLANPNAAADSIYIKKGLASEATRNALVYRPV